MANDRKRVYAKKRKDQYSLPWLPIVTEEPEPPSCYVQKAITTSPYPDLLMKKSWTKSVPVRVCLLTIRIALSFFFFNPWSISRILSGLIRIHKTLRRNRMQLQSPGHQVEHSHAATPEKKTFWMSHTSHRRIGISFKRMVQNVGVLRGKI